MLSLRKWSDWRRASHAAKHNSIGDLPPGDDLLKLPARLPAQAIVESAVLLRRRGRFFVRVRSRDGVEGIAVANERMTYLWPIMTQRVLSHLVGQDARHVEWLIDAIVRHDGNYKLAGLPFWSCLAVAEFALFDLLGKTFGQPVGELLGGVVRREIPVYLSSLRRDTTPEEEVARLASRLAETGAHAVKFKIGGRMGQFDATPGRTEKLVALARRTLGNGVTLWVDANGSYAVDQAVEIGRMLEDHGVEYFEEPCPWEDFEATRAVADRLERIKITGGEQDGSLEKVRWLVAHRGVDVIQPDTINNGGFLRTLRVARLAAAAGVPVSLHSSRSDFLACYMLHLASAVDHFAGPHEFHADLPRAASWHSPNFTVTDGAVAVPSGPGLGMRIDPRELSRAKTVG